MTIASRTISAINNPSQEMRGQFLFTIVLLVNLSQ